MTYLDKNINPKTRNRLVKKIKRFEKSFASFLIRKKRLTYLIVVFLLFLGIFQINTIPREVNPEVEIPFGIVTTAYPGASSIEVEQQVTKEIESKISDLSGIKKITSSSQFGLSSIQVEFEAGEDLDDSIRNLKDKADEAKSELPEDATDPVVIEASFENEPILVFALSSDNYDKTELKEFAQNLSDRLESIQNVNKVEIVGGEDKEIKIDLDVEKLQEFDLTSASVGQVLQANNTNVPLGSMDIENFNYALRVENEYKNLEDIKNIVVSSVNGNIVRMGDIADIYYGYEERSSISRLSLEGRKAHTSISISIYKRTGGDITKIADSAKMIIEESRERDYPADVDIEITTDMAKYAKESINDLVQNGIGTVFIILILLVLFVGPREAIITSLAVPFSFFVSFTTMAVLDQTFNVITLFALVLSLGILVDSAMVIVEGMYEKVQKYKMSGYGAAMLSVKEFSLPLLSGMLTTVAAFFPLLFVKGIFGQFLKGIPIVVIATLTAAFFVALTIVPTFGALLLKPKKDDADRKSQNPFDKLLKRRHQYTILITCLLLALISFLLIESPIKYLIIAFSLLTVFLILLFTKVFDRALKGLINKYDQKIESWLNTRDKRTRIHLIFAIGFLMTMFVMIFSIANPKKALIKIEAFGATDAEEFFINVKLPEGTILEETDRIVKKIEDRLYDVSQVRSFLVSVGQGDDNEARITVNLTKKTERDISSGEISEQVRERLKDFTAAEIEIIEEQGGPPTGSPLEARISGPDIYTLIDISEEMKTIMESIDGSEDVTTDISYLPGEFIIVFDAQKTGAYGLNYSQIALEIRNGISGSDDVKITQEGEEVKLLVSYGKEPIKNINDLANIGINTRSGKVALGSLAEIKLEPNLSSINRVDEERTVTVTGRNAKDGNINTIMTEFKDKVKKLSLPAGYEISYGGASQEQNEVYMDMFGKMFIGAILIIFILVAQFNSFKQMLIIILTVPLAMIGVIWGMVISRLTLDIPAFIGIISLWGIVVNDSIILIDQININRNQRGFALLKSAIKGGHARMQPILLTTATTVFGLLPLSLRDPNWQNLGFAIIFGLSFSTLLTLIFVPSIYITLNRMNVRLKSKKDLTGRKYKGFWIRLTAYLIDLAFIIPVFLLFLGILGGFLDFNLASIKEALIYKNNIFSSNLINIILLFILVHSVYFLLLTYKNQSTIGKAFVELRLRSTKAKDGLITLRQALKREVFGKGLIILSLIIAIIMIFSVFTFQNTKESESLSMFKSWVFIFLGVLIVVYSLIKINFYHQFSKTEIIDTSRQEKK
ncbi:MAG: MMPL family transporter [Candidatus Moranbacteria bacterium]|nr:MMPL family transporter [Candidatus Moranbacteria bacterium]